MPFWHAILASSNPIKFNMYNPHSLHQKPARNTMRIDNGLILRTTAVASQNVIHSHLVLDLDIVSQNML